MADRIKKKPSFFTLKRWNSQKKIDAGTPPMSPITPTPIGPPRSPSSMPANVVSRVANSTESRPRQGSISGIKELIQCPLCLEALHNPKMLPCQHTFCLACLSVLVNGPIIECPICRSKVEVTGSNFLNSLPSNLYIDSLLHIVGVTNKSVDPKAETPPTPTVNGMSVELYAAGVRCSNCQSMCDSSDTTNCQHCKLIFCRVCWSQHLDDMRTQVASILKQLDSAARRLEHKMEHFKDRCERITEQIKLAAHEKINAIMESRAHLLQETDALQKSGDLCALALKTSLEEATSVAKHAMTSKSTDDKMTVMTFVNLHQNALQILLDVSKWDTEHFMFDKENFRIEKDAATPRDAESEDPMPDGFKQNDPLESETSLIQHYRSRNFIPHYTWKKTSRPCGVGIAPWSGHLYICGMDSHCVMVVERSQAKIVTRLTHEDMLCPVQIAFMKSLGEIYVTDKWKHCVHVFSREGEYLRSLGQKGSREGMFRSPEGVATDNAHNHIYVVDTGNDRIQVIQPDGKFVDFFGVTTKRQINPSKVWELTSVTCTEFNAPTSVAVTADRVVVLDSGNRRVKVYNKLDKGKILEFGSMGQRKGQFRQAEVLAVDPMGFILVGDSGNCRVQVFKPNGQLVRVFGRMGSEPGKFGWISGIHVTKQLDIIISDTKTHTVNFF
ncbi:RING finger protein nhl-1-like isoform X1 [Plodia interpunctella]|uniref:RING finger protein nhl-1-like isoform X1 n=2 Tax=Plodia interpunctella TaxID=58824 RepID=UPI002367EED5|nr:RING finger protein nhl-1-like isoform X1 [Plodia interpunctella]